MKTALYVPGSSARMVEKSRGVDADIVILDLEDAVSENEKEGARARVVAELARPAAVRRWVRINPVDSPHHLPDLDAVAPARPDAILLAKAEPSSLAALDEHLDSLGADAAGVPVVALVETSVGLFEIAALCRSSTRLIGLQLGAEDLTAELGVERTSGGEEIRHARHQLALAAHAHGLLAIDTPQLAIGRDDVLQADLATARSCGMTVKTCIHPSQLAVVASWSRPTDDELAQAERVIAAARAAAEAGRGAAALDGQMIDAPVVARARRIVAARQTTPTPV